MFLYLMRHGEASRPSPGQSPSLTPRGLADVKRIAERFRMGNFKLDGLWHSPLTRARETTSAFLDTLERSGIAVEEKEWLSPEGDLGKALGEILLFKGSLLIVSHLPFLPGLSARLLEGQPWSTLSFPTAGLAAFESGVTFKHLWSLDPQTIGE